VTRLPTRGAPERSPACLSRTYRREAPFVTRIPKNSTVSRGWRNRSDLPTFTCGTDPFIMPTPGLCRLGFAGRCEIQRIARVLHGRTRRNQRVQDPFLGRLNETQRLQDLSARCGEATGAAKDHGPPRPPGPAGRGPGDLAGRGRSGTGGGMSPAGGSAGTAAAADGSGGPVSADLTPTFRDTDFPCVVINTPCAEGRIATCIGTPPAAILCNTK
jgi:hypothetical protein